MQEDAGNQPGRSRRADVGYKPAISVWLAAAKCARREATDRRAFAAKRQLQCLIGPHGDVAGGEEGKVAWECVVSEPPESVVDAGEVVFGPFLRQLCFVAEGDSCPPL